MTDRLIKEQVKTIEKATKDATQSKEKALKFLEDAGIIEKKIGHDPSSQNNTIKKK